MKPTQLHRVTVIGCGLIGTSIALALTRAGVEVFLEDVDVNAQMKAQLMGAGKELAPHAPPADLVVVATPPAAVVDALFDAQTRALGYAYTDVAGVKELIWQEAELRACDLMGYVPGHPMAGRETSGPEAAQADLFEGRPWILCPYPTSQPEAVAAVAELVALCGGVRRDMAPEEHDEAVAAVSHVPHLVSAALSAQLADVDAEVLGLAGNGLRDTTRIADGDPALWSDILSQNPEAVAEVVDRVAAQLAQAARELRDCGSDGSTTVDRLLRRGRNGRSALVDAMDAGPVGVEPYAESCSTPALPSDLDEASALDDDYVVGMAAIAELIAEVESGAARDEGTGTGPGEQAPAAAGDEAAGPVAEAAAGGKDADDSGSGASAPDGAADGGADRHDGAPEGRDEGAAESGDDRGRPRTPRDTAQGSTAQGSRPDADGGGRYRTGGPTGQAPRLS